MTECDPKTCEVFVKKMMAGYHMKSTEENFKKLKESCPLLLDGKYCLQDPKPKWRVGK